MLVPGAQLSHAPTRTPRPATLACPPGRRCSANPKKPLTFTLERNGEVVTLPITPAEQPDGSGRIGVSLAPNAEVRAGQGAVQCSTAQRRGFGFVRACQIGHTGICLVCCSWKGRASAGASASDAGVPDPLWLAWQLPPTPHHAPPPPLYKNPNPTPSILGRPRCPTPVPDHADYQAQGGEPRGGGLAGGQGGEGPDRERAQG